MAELFAKVAKALPKELQDPITGGPRKKQLARQDAAKASLARGTGLTSDAQQTQANLPLLNKKRRPFQTSFAGETGGVSTDKLGLTSGL